MVEHSPYAPWHGTTIVTVRKGGKVVIALSRHGELGNEVVGLDAAAVELREQRLKHKFGDEHRRLR